MAGRDHENDKAERTLLSYGAYLARGAGVRERTDIGLPLAHQDIPRSFSDFYYGNEHPDQFVRVHVPPASSRAGGLLPVVVIIHGGFWKERWHVNNAAHTTIAPSLARPPHEQLPSSPLSYVAVEVEYRRREAPGGGWPGTNNDVAQALQLLPLLRQRYGVPMDLNRLALLGHSAGGQLALWLGEEAVRRRKAQDNAEAEALPALPVPKLVVAVAPVTDMETGHEMKLSDEGDAIPLYMRCLPDSEENIAKYRAASPERALPSEVPVILAVGMEDTDVPASMVADFHEKVLAAGGASSELLTFDGADHYAPMDTATPEWSKIREAMDKHMAP